MKAGSLRPIVLATAGLTLLQGAGFWLLSPEPRAEPVRVAAPSYALLTPPGESRRSPEAGDWRVLFSPGVFLIPSPDDFSGRGWLQTGEEEEVLGAFTAGTRPLPYLRVQGLGGALPPVRVEGGLVDRWTPVGRLSPALAGSAPAVPLPERGGVWIVDGLAGWKLRDPVEVPAPPGESIPQRTVIRVAVDAWGGLATPPTLWEGSGDPGTDELALQWVAKLGFDRVDGSREDGRDRGWEWGLVGVRWPVNAGGTR